MIQILIDWRYLGLLLFIQYIEILYSLTTIYKLILCVYKINNYVVLVQNN